MPTTLSLVPKAVADVIEAMADRPADVQALHRQKGDIANDIDAALGKLGMCIYALPARPLAAIQGAAGMVYYSDVEIRVRVIETPVMNDLDVDAAEMAARVQMALAGSNPGGLFDDVLTPAATPFEISGVMDESTGQIDIHYDVLMHAPLLLGMVEQS